MKKDYKPVCKFDGRDYLDLETETLDCLPLWLALGSPFGLLDEI